MIAMWCFCALGQLFNTFSLHVNETFNLKPFCFNFARLPGTNWQIMCTILAPAFCLESLNKGTNNFKEFVLQMTKSRETFQVREVFISATSREVKRLFHSLQSS